MTRHAQRVVRVALVVRVMPCLFQQRWTPLNTSRASRACRARRDQRVATSATQHVTTFPVCQNACRFVSCRDVTWRYKWNLGSSRDELICDFFSRKTRRKNYYDLILNTISLHSQISERILNLAYQTGKQKLHVNVKRFTNLQRWHVRTGGTERGREIG